ncbi:MAG: 3-phosphoserine/phosphohydroxythreonine transaminase [Burkholderiales bacterium]
MTASHRVWNFSAGPAALPLSVLERVRAELTDWRGSGMSVMEMSHRGNDFMAIQAKAMGDLRRLLAVPDHYRIVFLQGGGIGEAAIVPLNLTAGRRHADYVNTGHWSTRAIDEARRFCEVGIAASAEDRGFTYVPAQATWRVARDAAYVHVCTNETLGGVEYAAWPDPAALPADVPIVADMSSHMLSRAVDVARFGVIYAGAQKNIGPAGLTLVIVRDDLLDRARDDCPSVFSYAKQAAADSMLNTPPTFAIYVAGLVFEWLEAQGGIAGIERANIAKASLLYATIDCGFYRNDVAPANRSRMNVPFFLPDSRLDDDFLAGAKARGLVQLKGHRVAGGMRASIYNAMPLAGVQALVDYLNQFAREHG